MASISIAAVIPLHNGAEFIRASLDSVLAQTRPADEIIVVDDGSTDDGAQIVAERAAGHPITVLRQDNAGQSSARNRAIRYSQCSHVAFLDQDDIWCADHLAVLAAPFEAGEVADLALVYGNLDQIDRAGRMILRCCLDDVGAPHPKRALHECLSRDMFILPGAALVDRAAMLAAGLFDERLSGYEDDDLFLRLFLMGYRSHYLNRAVTLWRIHAGSTSFGLRMARSRMVYFRKLVETFPDEPDLGQFWARDIIAPRFARTLAAEFLRASRSGQAGLMAQVLSNLHEVAGLLRGSRRARIALACPLASVLSRGPLTGLSRSLVRRAVR